MSALELLNDFDPAVRQKAFNELMQTSPELQEQGADLNMHFHSFYSYNAADWSPTRIAFEARKAGLFAAGLCDFDVLDGLEEFITAGEALGLRTTVNLETRVFYREYADKEITSPGEPGVTYIMGGGFPRLPDPESEAGKGLAGYRQRARERNCALISRINAALPDISIDYDADVIPLTPGGNATERHIMLAYIAKAESAVESPAVFWAEVSGKPEETVAALIGTPDLPDLVRAALAKRGGIGYIAPSEDTFPLVDDFIKWVIACNGIPMITWLDGTREGEADPYAILGDLQAKGAAALNIIPDRNWNLKDPEDRAIKQANLAAVITAADELNLPINIGTEMNKGGQPFTDELAGEALQAYAGSFIKGAAVIVGHTVLARYADYGFCSAGAAEDFPELTDRIAFFAAVGLAEPLDTETAEKLAAMTPEEALTLLTEKVA